MPTGPNLFKEAEDRRMEATEPGADSTYTLLQALVAAVQANTAAAVMSVENRHEFAPYEVDAWRDIIPLPPLKECKHKEIRRPACEERHTEDCQYADPPPEPEHVLLGVGTRVLVSGWTLRADGTRCYHQPIAGRIDGYDSFRSKYRWSREYGDTGSYSSTQEWAFVDNSVQVHPDGPKCPPPPQPAKREPTGPRIYVENQRGKQGHVVEVSSMNGILMFRVQWYVPGTTPVSKAADTLTIIPESQVDRCPNGQTGDECGSGENQCELCRQAEDEDGDEIERSMGLR